LLIPLCVGPFWLEEDSFWLVRPVSAAFWLDFTIFFPHVELNNHQANSKLHSQDFLLPSHVKRTGAFAVAERRCPTAMPSQANRERAFAMLPCTPPIRVSVRHFCRSPRQHSVPCVDYLVYTLTFLGTFALTTDLVISHPCVDIVLLFQPVP